MKIIPTDLPGTDSSDLIIRTKDLLGHFQEDRVSISLKYYKRSVECFSEWQRDDLKQFSLVNEKFGDRTFEQAKLLAHFHRGVPSKRFVRPENISEDIDFYSVAVGKKARVHGFFISSVFFLVWLDRNHECLRT